MILDIQYDFPQNAIYIGEYGISADEVAALALQARWHDIELVLTKAARVSKQGKCSREYLLATLCKSIGSLESYRFRMKQQIERERSVHPCNSGKAK